MPGDITVFTISSDHNVDVVMNNAYFERSTNIVMLFKRLYNLNKTKFIGKKIIVTSGDYPEDHSYYNDYDFKFSTTVPLRDDHNFNILPCPHSLSWESVDITNAQQMMKEMLVDIRQPAFNKIFWAGGPQHPQRTEYVEFSEVNNDICVTYLTDNSKQQQQQQYFLTMPDHANYKYLIDLQGQGYSARLKYLLASGRPIFIPDRPWVEHWHRLLVPWVHYVPVLSDFSDLRTNFLILEKDNNLYKLIADNARRFVSDYILLERQLPYIINTL